jgi:hypothetical protein
MRRIVTKSLGQKQLCDSCGLHLVCAGHSARENRMSRGHVCVAICDRAACAHLETGGSVHSQLHFAEMLRLVSLCQSLGLSVCLSVTARTGERYCE